MIHIYLFGPRNFVNSLLEISETHLYVRPVGVEIDDTDPVLYQALFQEFEKRSGLNIVLTPRFGDRFSTIALSMPKLHVYVVSGVNVEMLCGVKHVSPTLASQIVCIEEMESAHFESELLKSIKTEENLHSSHHPQESPSQDQLSQDQTSKENKSSSLISPPNASNDHKTPTKETVTQNSLNVEWSAITLSELLSAQGQDGICFLNSLLRAEDDESNIDLSVLETEYSMLTNDHNR